MPYLYLTAFFAFAGQVNRSNLPNVARKTKLKDITSFSYLENKFHCSSDDDVKINGHRVHCFILCEKLYDVPVGFVTPPLF